MTFRVLVSALTFLFLLSPLPAMSQSGNRTPPPGTVSQFVGAWQLVQIETKRRDSGEIVDSLSGTRVSGLLMYDSGGNMSVQLKRDWDPKIPYLAYFGTYTVDPKAGTVTHHVQMSSNNYKGTDQVRTYVFEDGGKRLILSPVNAPDVSSDVNMRLFWKRLH